MDIRIWIFVLVLICYFTQKGKFDKLKAKNYLATFSCVLLGIQSGLRHICVGPDTSGYYGFFMKDANNSFGEVVAGLFLTAEEIRDPGFAIVCKTFASLIPSWQLFLISLAILYFYSLGRLLRRYVESLEGILLAIVLNLALFNIIALSGIRQQITMSLSMLLIPLVEDKRWKTIIPIVLAGSMIHVSFLFYLAFIPLQMLHRDKLKNLVLFSILLIPIIATSARSIVGFMASQIQNEYYMGYAKSTQQIKPYTYVSMCSLISIFLFTYYNQLRHAPRFFTSALILMTLTVPLTMLDGSMIRIGQYFTIYIMLSLPYVIEHVHIRSLYVLFIVVLSALTFSQSSTYFFFWENVPGYYFHPFGISLI